MLSNLICIIYLTNFPKMLTKLAWMVVRHGELAHGICSGDELVEV